MEDCRIGDEDKDRRDSDKWIKRIYDSLTDKDGLIQQISRISVMLDMVLKEQEERKRICEYRHDAVRIDQDASQQKQAKFSAVQALTSILAILIAATALVTALWGTPK